MKLLLNFEMGVFGLGPPDRLDRAMILFGDVLFHLGRELLSEGTQGRLPVPFGRRRIGKADEPIPVSERNNNDAVSPKTT